MVERQQTFDSLRYAVDKLYADIFAPAPEPYDYAVYALGVTNNELGRVGVFGCVAEPDTLYLEHHMADPRFQYSLEAMVPYRCPSSCCSLIAASSRGMYGRTLGIAAGMLAFRHADTYDQYQKVVAQDFCTGLSALVPEGVMVAGDYYVGDDDSVRKTVQELEVSGHHISHPVLRAVTTRPKDIPD